MDERTAIQAIRRCWTALGAYRADAVLVGGMAVYAYRLLPGFLVPALPFRPLPTNDIDLALPLPLPAGKDGLLAENLAQAGLMRREVAKDGFLHTCWDVGDRRFGEAFVEFIAPSPSFMARDVEVQPGTCAFLTAYAWMLLRSPWSVVIDAATTVRVPHPYAYFVQKMLIRSTRPLDKRAKDLADALYVMAGLRSAWPGVIAEGRTLPDGDGERQEQLRIALDLFRLSFQDERSSGAGEVVFAHGLSGPPAQVLRQQIQLIASALKQALTTP